jgi:hypothetical protein
MEEATVSFSSLIIDDMVEARMGSAITVDTNDCCRTKCVKVEGFITFECHCMLQAIVKSFATTRPMRVSKYTCQEPEKAILLTASHKGEVSID